MRSLVYIKTLICSYLKQLGQVVKVYISQVIITIKPQFTSQKFKCYYLSIEKAKSYQNLSKVLYIYIYIIVNRKLSKYIYYYNFFLKNLPMSSKIN